MPIFYCLSLLTSWTRNSNYGLALFGLMLVWLIRRQVNKRAQVRYATVLGTAE